MILIMMITQSHLNSWVDCSETVLSYCQDLVNLLIRLNRTSFCRVTERILESI